MSSHQSPVVEGDNCGDQRSYLNRRCWESAGHAKGERSLWYGIGSRLRIRTNHWEAASNQSTLQSQETRNYLLRLCNGWLHFSHYPPISPCFPAPFPLHCFFLCSCVPFVCYFMLYSPPIDGLTASRRCTSPLPLLAASSPTASLRSRRCSHDTPEQVYVRWR